MSEPLDFGAGSLSLPGHEPWMSVAKARALAADLCFRALRSAAQEVADVRDVILKELRSSKVGFCPHDAA